MSDASHAGPVLLTGASGFVGDRVHQAMRQAGLEVRPASRYPERHGDGWVRADLGDPDSLRSAMAGCESAVYLVHRLDAGPRYPELEARGAKAFAAAAAEAGVKRIVYLGGVQPPLAPSRHLASRAAVGAILRARAVPTVELRAAMIVGEGSESWRIVRALAERLPMMVLPAWAERCSWPVAIDDVVDAIVRATVEPLAESRIVELPGPERVSHKEAFQRARRALGRSTLVSVPAPLLAPRLSALWITLVTGVPSDLVTELLDGLSEDLDPTYPTAEEVYGLAPRSIDEAMSEAVEERRASLAPLPARAG